MPVSPGLKLAGIGAGIGSLPIAGAIAQDQLLKPDGHLGAGLAAGGVIAGVAGFASRGKIGGLVDDVMANAARSATPSNYAAAAASRAEWTTAYAPLAAGLGAGLLGATAAGVLLSRDAPPAPSDTTTGGVAFEITDAQYAKKIGNGDSVINDKDLGPVFRRRRDDSDNIMVKALQAFTGKESVTDRDIQKLLRNTYDNGAGDATYGDDQLQGAEYEHFLKDWLKAGEAANAF